MINTHHLFPVRVYFEDTDTGGMVYHASHLRFMERARTEMLRAGGIDHARLIRDDGIMFIVRSVTIAYHKPARLDDELVVHTATTKLGNASVTLRQDIKASKNGLLISEATVILVAVNRDGAPCRIPATIRAIMKPAAA